MKKYDAPHSHRDGKQDQTANVRASTAATLNAILRNAYRRHSRGRLARAAMTACLGR